MGLFGRKSPRTPSSDMPPPARGQCACPEHVEDVLGLPVPLAREFREELDEAPMTVAELIDCSALGVQPCETPWFFDPRSGRRDDGPYHWTLWIGDEARASYDDDAPVPLDQSIDDRPGIELVAWEDREVIHVGAPTLCEDGVLAAAARALIDPRVRLPED